MRVLVGQFFECARQRGVGEFAGRLLEQDAGTARGTRFVAFSERREVVRTGITHRDQERRCATVPRDAARQRIRQQRRGAVVQEDGYPAVIRPQCMLIRLGQTLSQDGADVVQHLRNGRGERIEGRRIQRHHLQRGQRAQGSGGQRSALVLASEKRHFADRAAWPDLSDPAIPTIAVADVDRAHARGDHVHLGRVFALGQERVAGRELAARQHGLHTLQVGFRQALEERRRLDNHEL